MDNLISALLSTENTVILPGLGAIVVENEHTGKLMFNEYLRYNDHKLENILVENSNKTTLEAQNEVARYVKDIQFTLEKGETYAIYNLGQFFKTEDGSIDFEGNKFGDNKTAEATDSSIENPIPLSFEAANNDEDEGLDKLDQLLDVKETKTAESTEDASLPEEKSVAESESVDETPKSEENDFVESDLFINETKASDETVDKHLTAALAPDSEEKTEGNETNKTVEESDEPLGENATTTVINEKKKKPLSVISWIVIVLLLLFAGTSVFVALNYDEVKAKMGWDKFDGTTDLRKIKTEIDELIDDESTEPISETLTETAEIAPSPKSVEEKTTKEEQTKPVTPKNQNLATTGDLPYHIIGGGFSTMENANRLVEELTSKGFPASFIGIYNGTHYVSVKGFENRNAAINELETIRKEVSSAWVFKKP